uniref:TtsA-like Glycoside hydrolase family 108 domain-containing protein n=1 Tax=Thermodesulfobacterium geofontis TaxID=1295609 RepID=A0A7C4JQG3_9BACT
MKCNDLLEIILEKFLKVAEGGYTSLPGDPGGPTKYGIATNFALKEAKEKGIVSKDLNVKDLTWEQAKTIYKKLYWEPIKGDEIAEIDPRLVVVLFDTKVNPKKGIWDRYAEILGLNNWDIDKAIEVFRKMDLEERNKIIDNFINARLELYKGHRYEKGYRNRMKELKSFLDRIGVYIDTYCANYNKLLRSAYAEKTRRNVQEGSRRVDPLVIDLDGDEIELVNINRSNAMFDLTGSGFANRTGWISGGDAFLVKSKMVEPIFDFY